MASFTYTAQRNIKAGHSQASDYTITVVLQNADDEQPKPVKNTHKALDGTEVNVLHRIETYVDITTDLVAISGGTPDPEDFGEFFHSVAGGESFVYNDGTDHDAKMAGDVSRQRTGLYYTYSFRIRLI